MADSPAPAALDARVIRRRFERAAPSYGGASRAEQEIADRMLERLDYVKLEPRRVLDAGSGPLREARLLARRYPKAGIVALDLSAAMLRHGSRGGGFLGLFRRAPALRLCADFGRLPLAAASIDLVWSNMALHWAPDPLAVLREFHRVLAPGGLLMFSAPGPDTLAELRSAAGAARVHAFADMHDLGDQLLAAGFAEPVMDTERLTLVYPDAAALLADLRGSGQTSALSPASAAPRRGLAGRGFRARLEERLRAGARDGGLPVTVEAVYGHAWRAEARPAKRPDGRAVVRFERRR